LLKVGTERFVLPREEMQRLSLRYDAAVAALHDGRTSDASVLLESLAEDEERSFYQARCWLVQIFRLLLIKPEG
jgi:hypothetical protein